MSPPSTPTPPSSSDEDTLFNIKHCPVFNYDFRSLFFVPKNLPPPSYVSEQDNKQTEKTHECIQKGEQFLHCLKTKEKHMDCITRYEELFECLYPDESRQ